MNANFNPAELAGREAFDLPGRPRLIFGAGCSARAGELAQTLGARRALLVTDAGIVRADGGVEGGASASPLAREPSAGTPERFERRGLRAPVLSGPDETACARSGVFDLVLRWPARAAGFPALPRSTAAPS